jgi:endonuclease YncB( thermonuclease family)
MGRLTLARALIILMLAGAPALADSPLVISGSVTHVADGDTIQIGKHRIRLFGIDAPEMDTERGPAAAESLRRFLKGKPLTCVRVHTDRYARAVCICHAGGKDVAERQIKTGHARELFKFSRGFYASLPDKSQDLKTK